MGIAMTENVDILLSLFKEYYAYTFSHFNIIFQSTKYLNNINGISLFINSQLISLLMPYCLCMCVWGVFHILNNATNTVLQLLEYILAIIIEEVKHRVC